MQLQDFLSIVLPPPGHGYYCGVELKIVKSVVNGELKETLVPTQHKFVETIEELSNATLGFDAAGREAYFGVASFTERTSRTAANSSHVRSIFADLDCGDGKTYRDVAGALAAVDEWLVKSGFPVPLMVASGYGLHCYWPFRHAVPSSAWRPYAEGFKRLCAETGLAIDYTVSADAARVLRVPQTKNRKHGSSRPVRILDGGYDLETGAKDFEEYKQLLAHWKEEKAPLVEVKPNFDSVLDAAPAFAVGSSSYATDLINKTQQNFEAIVASGECGQIASYMSDPKRDGVEPLFRAVASIAKFCVDGEKHAYEVGRLHPYSDSRIAKKLIAINGPYKCVTFNQSSPGICNTCKFWGKISTPLHLGRELKEETVTQLQIVAQPQDTTQPPTLTTQTFPAPPKNYTISEHGVYLMHVDASGVRHLFHISDTPFFATATYDRAGERFVEFTYVEHAAQKATVMAMAAATGREEAIKSFAKIGIVVPPGKENEFRGYVKATIALAKQAPPIPMPTNLGWQDDDTFAFDGRVFHKDGERTVPMYGFENINETTGVCGSLDAWRLVVAGIMRLERWDIISMMSISFGAPLMKFTGLNGVTFHLCGNDSGRGKTLCQRLASSVWGVPDKFRTTPNTSPVAMINRLGMLGSLPLFVDEITHKGRNESEWFPEFLSQMSDGRGKDRMESQTNSERRNTTTWATMALMTSNKHMLDYLTAERAHGSEGEIRRLVEITFDKELNMDELTKSLLFDQLPLNYGVAGEAYARWLVRNVELVRSVVKTTYTEVFEAFGATGDERFWIAGCACILAGVRLAGKQYADVVEIPIGKVAKFLYDTVKYMRLETGRMKRTAGDVLNEFTKRNFGKLVVVNENIAKISGVVVAEVLDRRDLCGRVEKAAQEGWIDYYIEEKEIKSFCSSLSYGYTEFKRDLAKECRLDYRYKNLLAGTRGPAMVVKCICIQQKADITGSLFTEKAANE